MLYILKQISRLPFCVLYALSDVIYFFLYKIVGYRKKVVRRNLSSSFPDKSEKELREIERKFYHWLCDYFVETFKLLSITSEEMKKHMEVRNLEIVSDAADEGRGVSAYLGHYGNWEYLSATGIYYTPGHENICNGLIYHPLSNDLMDNLMKEARSSLGGVCIPKKNILRELVKLRRDNRPYLFGYIFDQSPKWENIHLWVDFLNHKTPVFTGAERISRKMNDRVVFVSMQRPKRGKYIATFSLVTDTPNELPEFELTKRCLSLLEKDIINAPHLYLWTHNRWKRTYEEYLERMNQKEENQEKEK